MTWTVERVDELRRLWAEGWSGSQIGAALGITKNAVIGKANRLGLTPRTKAHRPSKEESLQPKARIVNRRLAMLTPAAYRKPVPLPAPPSVPPSCQPISMMAMPHSGLCRFPVAAWAGPDAPFYCGSPDMAPDSSYCRWHHGIAQTWATRRRASLAGSPGCVRH